MGSDDGNISLVCQAIKEMLMAEERTDGFGGVYHCILPQQTKQHIKCMEDRVLKLLTMYSFLKNADCQKNNQIIKGTILLGIFRPERQRGAYCRGSGVFFSSYTR